MPLSYSRLGLALYHSLSTCLQYVLSELGTAIPEGLQQLRLDQQRHGDIKGSTHKLQIRKKLLFLNQPVDSDLTLHTHANIILSFSCEA